MVEFLDNVTFSYVEGPNNGPPLVLPHAQFLDGFRYSPVLPGLARSFHVFDVDHPGHGETTTPADYPTTALQIGADLGDFIERAVGEPVFVTGNSSGGLLAGWLAANRPDLINAGRPRPDVARRFARSFNGAVTRPVLRATRVAAPLRRGA